MKLDKALRMAPPTAFLPQKYARLVSAAIDAVDKEQERRRIEQIKNSFVKQ